MFLVRKLGAPGHEELALGAIASGGARVLSQDVVYMSGIDEQGIDAITELEQQELERRERAYRAGRGPVEIGGRIVTLIDDGLATGTTMLAAARDPQTAAREADCRGPQLLPARSGRNRLCGDAAAVQAVGLWYEDFSQTTDDEVRDLLARAARDRAHTR